jgi:hypothetical protein
MWKMQDGSRMHARDYTQLFGIFPEPGRRDAVELLSEDRV